MTAQTQKNNSRVQSKFAKLGETEDSRVGGAIKACIALFKSICAQLHQTEHGK